MKNNSPLGVKGPVKFVCVDCPGCPRCGGDPCAICESPELCKEHGCGDVEFKRRAAPGAKEGANRG
jgi:hypothetical protein